jgi:hypothetical protein
MDNYLDQFTEDQINGGYGDLLALESEDTDEYPDLDEPWDWALEQQELEDFEQCDEYFGYFGGEDW